MITTTTSSTSPSARPAPELTALQHIGLTVRDIAVSEAWYADVLGLVRAFVDPHPDDDGYAVVMTRPGTGLFIGLHHHPEVDGEAFSPRRTGLDHIALQVTSRDAIDAWVDRLDAVGADHEAVVERSEPVPFALVLVRDPDGIAIELFWFGG
jgi:glyoxylase I family protein